MKRSPLLAFAFAATLVVAAGAILALTLNVAHVQAPRKFNSLDISTGDYASDFDLVDPDGRHRTLGDFRGKVVLLFFGFTQCPSACPTELARSGEVLRLLGAEAARVQMVFVTVDPERDTPDLLRNYVHAFNPSFLGLRADLATTAATAKGFHAFYTKVPTGDSYTMDHTTITYAFDPGGHIRLAMRDEQDAASIAADVHRLLAETT